jgi:hypothetical protein
MRARIALAFAALMFLSAAASAQYAPQYGPYDRYDRRYGYDRDERAYFNRGYEAGYRAALEHRGWNSYWVRGWEKHDRKAFERGFKEGQKRGKDELRHRRDWDRRRYDYDRRW